MRKTVLRQERELRGWTQKYVADQIGTTELSISRWETGTMSPRGYFRTRLVALFGKTEHQLGLEAADAAPPATTSISDPAIPLLPTHPLVGRDDLLSTLRQRLRSGGNSALSGLPGVGKTTLCIALANDPDLSAHFRDGIVWAGLGPEPNVLGHLLRWGALLGIAPDELSDHDLDRWSLALHHALSARRMLLILDDVWTVEDALRFKIGGPACAHLVTTRFPAIATTLAAEGALIVEELSSEEGIALLRLLAPWIVEQEPHQVRELVEAVGGLPLALTLMGNHLRIQGYRSHSRRLLASLHLLRTDASARLDLQETRSPAERHSSQPGAPLISLRSILAVTVRHLERSVRRALAALSVFPPKPNSFSEEAALAIATCSTQVLDALVDAGVLQITSANRYLLHPTIADYACMELEHSGDFDQAHRRLIAYITRFLEAHHTDDQTLAQEYTNILAALEAAFYQDGVTVLPHLACMFAPFLLSRGLSALAEHHLQRAYDTAALLGDETSQSTVRAALEHMLQPQGHTGA